MRDKLRFVQRLLFVGMLISFLHGAPASATRRPDIPPSKNGDISNCDPNSTSGGPCLYFQQIGAVTLNGTVAQGAPKVTATFYDYGTTDTATGQHTIIWVVVILELDGTDTSLNLVRFSMAGLHAEPAYVTCAGSPPFIPCNSNLTADDGYLEEPTPVSGVDGKNTEWDFSTQLGNRFVDIQCISDSNSAQPCPSGTLGRAILGFDGSVADNHITFDQGAFSALVQGAQGPAFELGGLTTATTAPVGTNDTKDKATIVSGPTFQNFIDTSQMSPSEDSSGNMVYPPGFALPPAPHTCNPPQGATTFRTAWYKFLAPSDGTVSISTAKSHYDTLVYVLKSDLSEVACNDDQNDGSLQAAIDKLPVFSGETYDVIVLEAAPLVLQQPDVVAYPLSTDGILYFSLQFNTSGASVLVTPTSLDFGSQLVNTTSTSQTVTLANDGASALSITNISTSSNYSQTSNCPASLPAAGTCTLTVSFSPTKAGVASGKLTITDDASDSPQVVPLSGIGTDFQIAVSPFSPATINAGQTSTATVTATGLSGFNSAISLSCSVAPATATPPTCSLSPSSLPNGSGDSTVSVTTVAPTLQTTLFYGTWGIAGMLISPIGLMGLMWCTTARKLHAARRVLGLSSLAMFLAVIMSCGGGSSQTPTNPQPVGGTTAGAYTITITATSGQATQTTNSSITVH